jgi:hypothetical protein
MLSIVSKFFLQNFIWRFVNPGSDLQMDGVCSCFDILAPIILRALKQAQKQFFFTLRKNLQPTNRGTNRQNAKAVDK